MFKARIDAIVKPFDDQFERSASGYFYRRNGTGPVIEVSVRERDQFVDTFVRRSRAAYWAMLAGVVFALLGGVYLTLRFENLPSFAVVVGTLAPVVVAYLLANRWMFGEPERALRQRVASQPALTKAQREDWLFKRISYGNLAGVAFAAIAYGTAMALKYDPREGWNALWLVVPVGALVGIGIQTGRKWLHDREKSSGTRS